MVDGNLVQADSSYHTIKDENRKSKIEIRDSRFEIRKREWEHYIFDRVSWTADSNRLAFSFFSRRARYFCSMGQ